MLPHRPPRAGPGRGGGRAPGERCGGSPDGWASARLRRVL